MEAEDADEPTREALVVRKLTEEHRSRFKNPDPRAHEQSKNVKDTVEMEE